MKQLAQILFVYICVLKNDKIRKVLYAFPRVVIAMESHGLTGIISLTT